MFYGINNHKKRRGDTTANGSIMSNTKRRILITGGAGFIGANFVHAFVSLGYDVFVIERKQADRWRLQKVKSKIHVYSLDLPIKST